MDKACKSNEKPCVQFFGREHAVESGRRVSNAWAIYLEVGDTPSKGELIPNVVPQRMLGRLKAGIFRDLPL